MQVFNTFFKIAKKQIPITLMYIGIFAVLCIMMGGTSENDEDAYNFSACDLVVVDRDNSEESAMLVKYLEKIHEVDSKSDYTDEQIQDYLYYQKIDYVLYIESGYAKTGELTNIKRPDSKVGEYIDSQISVYESNMNALLLAGYSNEEAYALTLTASSAEGLVTFMTGEEQVPPIYYALIFAPFVLIMVMFYVLAPVLAAFNHKEISKRLNVSPITSASKNIQIVFGQIVMSILVWILFLAFLYLYYGIQNMDGKLPFILLNSMAMVIIAASMAGIVGNLRLRGDTLNVIANITGLAMSFLGGVFVHIKYMGSTMLKVARFMPTYWYINANEKIFNGDNANDIFMCIGVELLFALVFFMVSMVISKQMRAASKS
ncbi:MAG: ABC transporter permease [Clostridium sp.]|nr:ABC transporter permease [Clostridium sp.]MCM1399956.1 ABC transporter permease [Clostridium sp.]MCM1460303.1 ABC transporter permease [Bacteroides sp.]